MIIPFVNRTHRLQLNVFICGIYDSAGFTDHVSIIAALGQVAMLCQDVGIPQHLGQVGVKADQIPILAEQAIQDTCHHLNPRVCTLQDMTNIYSAAI